MKTNNHAPAPAIVKRIFRWSPKLSWSWPLVPLSLAAATGLVAVAASTTGDSVLQRVVTGALISVILVIGLYVFSGNSGILSFGHVSFMAVSAYACAILTMPPEFKQFSLPDLPTFLAEASLPFPLAVLASGLLAAAFGAVVSIPLLRLAGIQAGIGTLAVLIIVRVVISNWDSVTGGQNSIVGVPVDANMGTAWLWCVFAIGIAYAYQTSTLGLKVRATREDDIAAAASGVNVVRHRRIALILSAFLVGVGGGLWSHYGGVVSPDSFYLSQTFILVVMLVVGGLRSLSGAVVGTLAIAAVSEVLRRLELGTSVGGELLHLPTGVDDLALAAAMLAVLVFRPNGLVGNHEVDVGRLFRRRRSRALDGG